MLVKRESTVSEYETEEFGVKVKVLNLSNNLRFG
jgi:hypothetical protein